MNSQERRQASEEVWDSLQRAVSLVVHLVRSPTRHPPRKLAEYLEGAAAHVLEFAMAYRELIDERVKVDEDRQTLRTLCSALAVNHVQASLAEYLNER